MKHMHTFGCPVFALQNALASGNTLPRWSPLGAPDKDLPPFFSENSGGMAISQYLENLGGDMARPRIKNLTSPIFDNF
jgi:hypothetical protein